MNDKSAELLSSAINEMKSAGKNHQEIATVFLGGAIAVLVDSIGTAETANFLYSFAGKVADSTDAAFLGSP